ncbi:MAG: hypothetical protein ACPG31_02000 [Planctomycetota bacterium]
MKTLMMVILTLAMCSCTAPEARQGDAKAQAVSKFEAADASFPIAAAPEFDADGSTQEERDLERIGRRD